MLPQDKHHKSLGFHSKPYADGPKLGSLNITQLREDTDDMEFQMTQDIKKVISIAGSLARNKKMILKGKSNSFKQIRDFWTQKLSQISAQESISDEKDFKGFWINYSKEISKKLWSLHQTVLSDSDSSFSKISSKDLVPKSRFYRKKYQKQIRKNWQKISSQSSQFLQPDTTASENIIYCRKIRIYPNPKQHELFKKCIGTSRFIYNKCVDFWKKKIGNCNLINMRNEIMGKDSDLSEEFQWLKEVPYDTRQLSIKNFVSSLEGNLTKLKNNQITHFDMKFRKKKEHKQVFYVDRRALKLTRQLFRSRNKKALRFSKKNIAWWEETFNKAMERDLQISWERSGKFYLIIPMSRKPIDTKSNFEVASLDPGVRTFQTSYSPEGEVCEFGINICQILRKYYEKIDHLTSLRKKKTHKFPILSKTKYRMGKRCEKSRAKISNIVNDLHWKTASYLVKNYTTIIIPKFGVKNMVNRNISKIRKITKRTMLGLRHYEFRQRLEYMAKVYQRKLIVTTEEYTSKTCGLCGTINEKLGSSKKFVCVNKKCEYQVDRDVNGARNILIRYLSTRVGRDPLKAN